jgi:hypothetical protein
MFRHAAVFASVVVLASTLPAHAPRRGEVAVAPATAGPDLPELPLAVLQPLQAAPAPSSPAAGVADVRLADFFQPTVGDRGLEYTAAVTALHGKVVRLRGYMVLTQKKSAGLFLLAPFPVKFLDDGYCTSEDYPPATVHVLLPGHDAELVPHLPGLLEVRGRLELGAAVASDGRASIARLHLDPALLAPHHD